MANSRDSFRIGIVPLEGFALMSYAAIVEPLRAANTLKGTTLYDVKTVQLGPHPTQSSGGDLIPNQIAIRDTKGFDLVLVTAAANAGLS